VSGTVTVSAGASDDTTIASVQFLLDGAPLGPALTGPPYSTSWTTTAATNGPHTLSARASDSSGNTATSPGVSVTVSNTGPIGLVAGYAFSETTGATARDASGNGNNGTVSGATWTASGKYGRGLSFDGVNDRVNVANAPSLNPTGAITLMAWVYPTITTGVRDIVIKEGNGVDIYNLYQRNGNGRAEMNVLVGGVNRTAEGASLARNTWTHLAGTYDGATVRLFVNGTQVASTAASGPLSTSTGALRIGGNSLWGEYFRGRLDEVRVYNRALTQAEIQAAMGTPLP
jgi:hypothetical protein